MAREPRDEGQQQDPFVEFMHTLQHFIAVFLEYTWYMVREILYLTLDIVCLVLLIISCACPTRTLVAPYVYLKELCRNPVDNGQNQYQSAYAKIQEQRSNARYASLVCFVVAVIDTFIIAMSLVILCVPTRTFPFLKELYLVMTCPYTTDEFTKKFQFNFLYRLTVSRNFGRIFLDLISVVLFLFSFGVTPWFSVAYIRSIWYIAFVAPMQYYDLCAVDPQQATFDRNQARQYSKFQYRKCIHFIRMASSFARDSLIDTFTVVPAFSISLIVPSRTIIVLFATLKRVVFINGPECQHLAPTAGRDYHHEYYNNQESQSLKMQESRRELRLMSKLNMISSLIDIIAIPLGLVGVFSTHGPALVREIFAAFRSAGKLSNEDCLRWSRVFDRDNEPPFLCANTYVHRSYNYRARLAAIYHGMFAIVDIFAVPFLLLTVVGFIRIRVLFHWYQQTLKSRKPHKSKSNNAAIPTQLVASETMPGEIEINGCAKKTHALNTGIRTIVIQHITTTNCEKRYSNKVF